MAELITCADLEESQEDQASLGLRGVRWFSLPPVLPLLGADRPGRREPTPSLCTNTPQQWGVGRRRKPGRKNGGTGPPLTHLRREPWPRHGLDTN